MNRSMQTALFVVIAAALYNLFDFAYTSFIAHQTYQFTGGSLMIPCPAAMVNALLALNNNEEKNSKTKK